MYYKHGILGKFTDTPPLPQPIVGPKMNAV